MTTVSTMVYYFSIRTAHGRPIIHYYVGVSDCACTSEEDPPTGSGSYPHHYGAVATR